MNNYTVIVKLSKSESNFLFKKETYSASLFEKPEINITASSYDEAIKKIYEKTLSYFDSLSDQGLDIPKPAEMSMVLLKNRDQDVFFHIITIDTSIYSEKTEKINVTMPISLTKKIDDFLKDKVHNKNLFSSRSDYITKACKQYLPSAYDLAAIFNNEKKYTVIRYNPGNTTDNCCNLIEYLDQILCVDVILFATHTDPIDGFSSDDGPDTNLPLMGAVAKIKLPALQEIYILFDGLFLTAQRQPRYNEVKDVLDKAVSTNKTSFIQLPVPFTSQLDAEEAVKLLAEFPHQKLTQHSRPEFFNLLSNFKEEEYM